MGYYISVLQEGKMYDLNGQKLKFIEKFGSRYYFNICKFDEWRFKYFPTEEVMSYDIKEINYIKRFQDEQKQYGLKRIGKEKVFPRY